MLWPLLMRRYQSSRKIILTRRGKVSDSLEELLIVLIRESRSLMIFWSIIIWVKRWWSLFSWVTRTLKKTYISMSESTFIISRDLNIWRYLMQVPRKIRFRWLNGKVFYLSRVIFYSPQSIYSLLLLLMEINRFFRYFLIRWRFWLIKELCCLIVIVWKLLSLFDNFLTEESVLSLTMMKFSYGYRKHFF